MLAVARRKGVPALDEMLGSDNRDGYREAFAGVSP
jgi:hypothetical protein